MSFVVSSTVEQSSIVNSVHKDDWTAEWEAIARVILYFVQYMNRTAQVGTGN